MAKSGLFLAKKMYAIHMLLRENMIHEQLKCTGVSLRRSSTPKVLKPFLENILNCILDFKSKKEIDKLILMECEKLKNRIC